MRTRKGIYQFISILLAALLLLYPIDMDVFVKAQEGMTGLQQRDTQPPEEKEAQQEIGKKPFINGSFDSGYIAPRLTEQSNETENGLARAAYLPTSYSSVDKGYVTSVKYQGNMGSCWAYAAVAAMESYALSHGLVSSADEIDLSEYALAYMTFDDTSFTDNTGGTSGDVTTTPSMYESLRSGGNSSMAFKTLSKWAGVFSQTDAPNINYLPQDGSPGSIFSYDREKLAYILTGQYHINMQDSDLVKQAIMENGALSVSYCADDKYEAWRLYAYCYENMAINHSVALVGWDDTIAKENFTMTDANGAHTPAGDGAWLIKNSWGTGYGKDGYMWISYYDLSIDNSAAVVFAIAPADTYDYNYQYDGSSLFGSAYSYIHAQTFANVFTAAGSEGEVQYLDAVAFSIEDASRSYEINIYKNPETDQPESGTPLLRTPITGKTSFAGYYTVTLPETVKITQGDTFSVVISFDKETKMTNSYKKAAVGYNGTAVNAAADNQSYYYAASNRKFVDLYESGYAGSNINFCIKAFAAKQVDAGIRTPEIIEIAQKSTAESPSGYAVEIQLKTVDGAGRYEIFRSVSPNGVYDKIYEGEETVYADLQVQPGQTYYYKSRAINNKTLPNSYSADSAVRSIAVGIPAAQLAECVSDGAAMILRWGAVSEASGYEIYRSENGIDYERLAQVEADATEYRDISGKYNREYYYAIVTYRIVENEKIDSVRCQAVKATKQIGKPGSVNIDTSAGGQFTVQFGAVAEADGYKIYHYEKLPDNNGYDGGHAFVEIADVSADTLFYVDRENQDASGTYTQYGVAAYLYEDGVKKVGTYVVNSALVRYPCIEDIRYTVNADGIYVLDFPSYAGAFGTVTNYRIYLSDAKDGTYKMQQFRAETGSSQSIALRYYDLELGQYISCTEEKNYYVKVVAYGRDNMYRMYELTCLQEEAIKIGSNAEPEIPEIPEEPQTPEIPQLDRIADVSAKKGDQTVLLEANVSNRNETYQYRYQWYRFENEIIGDLTAQEAAERGTAIAGAAEYSYVVNTDANGTFYYCCVVTAVNETKTSSAAANVVKVVVKTALADANVTTNDFGKLVYDGNRKEPIAGLYVDGIAVDAKDYTVTYRNNVAAGRATAVITAADAGYYTGSVELVFEIARREIAAAVFDSISEKTYTGSAIMPAVSGTDLGKALALGRDYQVAYANNTNPGTATVTVSGTGNYTGTKILTFTIQKKEEPETKAPESVTPVNQAVAVNNNKNLISKITEGTTAAALLAAINERSYCKVYRENMPLKDTDLVTTGSKLCIMENGAVKRSYDIVVTGDVNGDGKINITDMIAVKSHILGKSLLTGTQGVAADVNGDGKINITDFIKVKAAILKKDKITGIAVN